MRVSLRIDSATEPELRDVLNAYVHATGRTDEVKVGLNGPACYSAETPPLKGREAWALLDHMSNGALLDGLVREDHGDAGFGEAPDPATPDDGFSPTEWAAAWGVWVT